MEILQQLQVDINRYLRDKFKQEAAYFKFQNKLLKGNGDIVAKFANRLEDPEYGFQDSSNDTTQWVVPVQSMKLTSISVTFFINREKAYQQFIMGVILKGFPLAGANGKQICLKCDTEELNLERHTLSDFRILSIHKVIRNILMIDGYNVSDAATQTVRIGRNPFKKSDNSIDILCGPVLTNGLTAAEYISKRSNDMQLIAQHKYGIRVKDSQKLKSLVASLGRSAAIVDMLESKASSPIDLRKDKNASSKGASFILYNYARLAILFRTFEEKTRSGYYPDSPDLSQVDFSLLSEEDEWQLFWVYVVGFPNMLKQALGGEQLAHLSPHLVLNFTSGLVICLSRYYRRVRILTENRDHLLPTLFARIGLLKSVFQVLSKLLHLLDLEAIEQM
ncbi:DALR anticodon-binding domain-containing protein 3 [Toxorhynchites rutilus septentrionalis]|uniref:DALR anticodon-binding domain-containing protein 3 n=1 Tax=Toxorhynchites rutilus septentrionalis TaxID=329112 RepID=UPI002478ABB6|nr:DALR anticodon-binding domain-containing protein 3 [Toxorhynchites rutilus septentrionalis]